MHQLIYVQVDCTGVISIKTGKINKFHPLLERWESIIKVSIVHSSAKWKYKHHYKEPSPKLLEHIEVSTINRLEKIAFGSK